MHSRLRRYLVAGQIGLALVLLAGAGLFLRSFIQLSNESAGFDPQNLLAARLSLPASGYANRQAFVDYYDKLLPRLAAMGLELAQSGRPPEIHFGWTDESPISAHLDFLLFGQGNIPWMVRELVLRAEPDAARRPRIILG